MNNEIKISFVGDVMCERPLLNRAATKDGFDFSTLFEDTAELLSSSDYVVANLETPFAGKGKGYGKSLFSFNSPDEFVEAVANSEIDAVQTANNHCLDCGVDGLVRTMKLLEKKMIPYFGTSFEGDKRGILVRDIGGIKVGFLGYTLTSNFDRNHIVIKPGVDNCVSMLLPSNFGVYGTPTLSKRIKKKIISIIGDERIISIKRSLGKYNPRSTIDSADEHTLENLNKNLIKEDIDSARERGADIIICEIHGGGQFNTKPGPLMEHLFSEISQMGVDAIVASHPHTVQKICTVNGVPSVFSLGNFSMSPSSPYLVKSSVPEYGIIVHLFVDGEGVSKGAFSVIKMVETQDDMRVVPVKSPEGEDEVRLSDVLSRLGFGVHQLAPEIVWYEREQL